MNSLRSTLLGIAVSSFGLLLAACGGDGPSSTMTFSWKLGAGVTCTDAGLSTIKVSLINAQTKKPARTALSLDCAAGTGQMAYVTPGTYSLTFDGLASAAETTATWTASVTGVIVKTTDKTTALGTVRLAKIPTSALPSSLVVQWPFQNGLGCEANNVKDVRITAWREKSYLELDKTTACGPQTLDLSLPAGSYSIIVEGMTADGTVGTSNQVDNVTSPPTGADPVRVVLSTAPMATAN